MVSRAVFVIVCASLFLSGYCVPSERRLHDDLLAGYNKAVRPVLNESASVNAKLGMSFIDFSLDSNSDVMESLVWMRMKWTDQYLRWDPSEYDGIKTSMFNPAVIWTPDICHYNGWERSCHITDNPRSNAIVESDGTVLWVPPVRLSSRCDLDRTNWPRDTATCCIKFGSWTYNGHRVNLSMFTSYEPDVNELRPNREWQVVESKGTIKADFYDCCPEPYQSLNLTIIMRRNEHRTAELAMPVICASVLMLLSFLVPLSSAQKLTFSWVSVLFTMLGLLNMFGKLPTDAHGVASIATFYVTFTALLLIFTTLEVVVVCLSRPRSAPLPRVMRACLSGLVGRLLCLDTPVFHDYSPEDNEMLDSSHDGEFQKQAKDSFKNHEWAILAGAIDRLLGLVFLLIVAVVLPPNLTWA
ncbi:neuronal acetylcholine receptor subunit alpha-7-like [Pollicipes pollicipes]|uniref:neuronal acetylcholine receptor subunit alpha-7-like n=1 Tax=Pollicipes pollicipes TaxID=41117 RepID=UPI0018859D1D|nr:neuronal acetylcholine receptor subunit alpha-7-like [Pollicipes pollicipes]